VIEIPFLPEFESALRDGRKTATSRSKRYGNPGDQFTAFGMEFLIMEVRQEKLADISLFYYGVEGLGSPAEFIAIWRRIHPRKEFDPEREVWFHRFKRLS